MAGERPKICVAIVSSDAKAISRAESDADLWEVRIDLIGKNWQNVAGHLKKPWIACNRRAEEGGKWRGREPQRVKELLSGLELGASIIDIELGTQGLDKVVGKVKGHAKCLISYHNLKETPPLDRLRQIVINQMASGADICKVVTKARTFKDNLAVLQLISEYPGTKVVAFAMGTLGQISRVICPLAGGYFTYASVEAGKESAEGQITAGELKKIYGMLGND